MEGSSSVLSALNLPETTALAKCHLRRASGETIPETMRGKQVGVGGGAYRNGVDIKRDGSSIELTVWTVDNSTYVAFATLLFTHPDGKLASGRVNCFSLGWIDADEGYAEWVLDELKNDPPAWDICEEQK
jgi:hypothetical protein